MGSYKDVIWPDNFFESDPHMASLLNIIPDAIFICNDQGKIVYTNDQINTLTGYVNDELTNQLIEILIPKHLRKAHVHLRNEFMKQSSMHEMSRGLDLHITHKDGHGIPVDISLSPLQTLDGTLILAVVRDITERKEAQEGLYSLNKQLQALANHDALTSLPNRLYLYDTLHRELSRAQRHHHKIAFLYIDLDDFKAINDTGGHDIGDKVLMQIAKRLKSNLRNGDFVARLGGDEFAVALIDIDRATTKIIAEKLIHACREPLNIDGRTFQIGASIGIAGNIDNKTTPESLIHQADAAMYMAKKAGRDCFVYYETLQSDDS